MSLYRSSPCSLSILADLVETIAWYSAGAAAVALTLGLVALARTDLDLRVGATVRGALQE